MAIPWKRAIVIRIRNRYPKVPDRYKQIDLIIDYLKPASIVEVGTWNGDRAIDIAQAALKHHTYVHYWGFDVFEHAADDQDQRELNVKPHTPLEDVRTKLEIFRERRPGFSFNLIKGDTRFTLHHLELPVWSHPSTGNPVQLTEADLVFIDGGHSIETIENDFHSLGGCKNILMDDYYSPCDRGLCPDVKKFGCNQLVERMPHWVLPVRDPVAGGGHVQIVALGTLASLFVSENIYPRSGTN